MDRRFQFEIPVRRCLNGYAWVEGARVDGIKKPTAVLCDVTAADPSFPRQDVKLEEYRPLETESGLFRIFAQLPLEQEAIRRFANAYGNIYDLKHKIVYTHDGRNCRAHGTSLSTWRQTILAVRHWLSVWDYVCDNDARGLLKYVSGLEEQLEAQDLESNVVRTLVANSWPIVDAQPKDRIRAAKKCLWLGVWESELRKNTTVHLRYDENRDTFGFRLRAEDLVVAIWAQLAMAIIDSKEYTTCKVCGKPFEVSPEVARTNREYCGTPCRLKAYRGRQREAKRLSKRGKSLKDIAAQLESDVKTVRGWIKKAEEKQSG